MGVWFLGQVKYLVGRSNEWVAYPLGPGQTSAHLFLERESEAIRHYISE